MIKINLWGFRFGGGFSDTMPKVKTSEKGQSDFTKVENACESKDTI